ncbi:hypothetical protein [Lunatibacter salilacus]|uniref:hypothetical protein n=1 Tax=Lunatibacter salilacus TaxID=2483804 RepID=UPI00131B55FC|nr:hypothetical protein [Lunatibacter salilacus]
MGNHKKFSLLICFFLIVNQDIIGNRQFEESQESIVTIQSKSIKSEDHLKVGSIKSSSFLHLPHTSIYLK